MCNQVDFETVYDGISREQIEQINRELMKKAVERWGTLSQQDMLVEECSELIVECAGLIKAVQKKKRGKIDTPHLIEEAVDVELCLEQLKLILGQPISWSEFRNIKMKRLSGLLK